MRVREYDLLHGTHYDRDFRRASRRRRALARQRNVTEGADRFIIERRLREYTQHTSLPADQPHGPFRIVDDRYHEQQSFRERLTGGSRGELLRRLHQSQPDHSSDDTPDGDSSQ